MFFWRVSICMAGLLVSAPLFGQEKSELRKVETVPEPLPSVSLTTTKEVLVEHRDSAQSPWHHVCAASAKAGPCAFNPKGGEYRVIGVDVSPSVPFAINGKGALKIDIGVAPLARRGLWVMGGAAVAVTLGLALIFSSAGFVELQNGAGANGVLRDEKIGVLATGTFFTIAGLATGLYGGALYWNNGRSRVSGPIADLAPRKSGFVSPFAFTF